MAKLKGPLFSLGASQKLGNALVFFPWKGLNVVREYVIPSNPKSTGQRLQRLYLKSGVDLIHAAQQDADHPLVEIDVTAYALWASAVKAATTWFNQAVKNCIDQLVAGKYIVIYHGAVLVETSTNVNFTLYYTKAGPDDVTDGYIWYGTSKTALNKKKEATPTDLAAGVDIDELTNKVKYYFQYRPTAAANRIGANSGIYHATPHV